MDQVTKVLSNPAIKQGLKVIAPEIGLGIDLVMTIVSGFKKPRAEDLMKIIDRQLAAMLKELATTKSRPRQQELEIRIHTLLGVIMEMKLT